MMEFGESGEERPERREAEAGREPSSLSFYDPLISPWDESLAPASRDFAGAEDPLFAFGYEAGLDAVPVRELGWETGPVALPVYQQPLGAWRPAGYQPPYQDTEGLSELQRRLRAGTITVPRPQRRWAVTIREVVETLLLALLIFLAVRASFQNFKVEGLSMVPSLEDGEYLIVNKLTYAQIDLSIFDWLPFYDAGNNPVHHLWASPARGDVIVFRAPTNVDRDFIKRIIGVPGDTIQIMPDGNQVLVNGKPIDEPFIQGITTCSRGCGPWTVPPAHTNESIKACGSAACYFVMGDNRQNSSDSRQGWLVPEENIIGKTLITYWHKGGPELDLAPNHSVSLAAGE